MVNPAPLSKRSVLVMHLIRALHVWRDEKGFWVASTERNKRNVHLCIIKLEQRGMVVTCHGRNFPELTDAGIEYLSRHPLHDVLESFVA